MMCWPVNKDGLPQRHREHGESEEWSTTRCGALAGGHRHVGVPYSSDVIYKGQRCFGRGVEHPQVRGTGEHQHVGVPYSSDVI